MLGKYIQESPNIYLGISLVILLILETSVLARNKIHGIWVYVMGIVLIMSALTTKIAADTIATTQTDNTYSTILHILGWVVIVVAFLKYLALCVTQPTSAKPTSKDDMNA